MGSKLASSWSVPLVVMLGKEKCEHGLFRSTVSVEDIYMGLKS